MIYYVVSYTDRGGYERLTPPTLSKMVFEAYLLWCGGKVNCYFKIKAKRK